MIEIKLNMTLEMNIEYLIGIGFISFFGFMSILVICTN